MTGSEARLSPLHAAWVTVLLAVVVGIGLFEASVALRLRSIHSSADEALGWAALGLGLVLLSAPSVLSRSAPSQRPTALAWVWVLLIASVPTGFLVMQVPAPLWLNPDVVGGIVSLAMASVALALVVSQRASLGGSRLLYGMAGTVAFVVVGGITWAMLFLE
jgi:hypothetical protein